VQISSIGTISHHANFDGITQLELLDSNNSQLALGQSGSLILEVDVNPNLPLVTYTNQVVGVARAAGSGIVVSDISTQGLSPDPDGNGNPDEAVPTPVSLRLFVPNGFSPNGDGENDAFVIKGLDKYPNNRIEIFNRWGNKIYEAAPYDNSWTGTALATGSIVLGDGLLPNGTYFYVLDFGIAGIAPQQGFVVIKK
jgi:gliding motility-associated-like protein